jgi:hypothetical protein
LLKSAAEENICYQCHSLSGGAINIQSIAAKAYTHPVADTSGIHDPTEAALAVQKHVECLDCHNTHQSNDDTAIPPTVSGNLKGVKGISSAGVAVATAVNQYEICYRCHSDNGFFGPQTVVRRIQELNTRLDFDPGNPSFHPIVTIGKNSNVPSLRTEYSTSSMIYCSDCHSSNGTAPKGPHGSDYPHILVARYETDTSPLSYNEGNYALCFKCHDQNILLDNLRSAFPPHQKHVQDNGIACSVCHDPHGVSSLRGATVQANAHLINFDTRFVTSGNYDSVARSCTVSCHATRTY